MIAIIPPFDNVKDPESEPDAPASEPPEPAVEPASPAEGPLPGCSGVAVAKAENNEDTELADISGVKETNDVVAEGGAEVTDSCSGDWEELIESCAITLRAKKFSIKLRSRIVLILMPRSSR